MHPTPPSLPNYGYVLECDDAPVGVILLISSVICEGNTYATRCNLSSLYVEPRYASYAALLTSRAIKHKNVTYLNISPAVELLPFVEAQGFSRYSSGQFVALPISNLRPRGAQVSIIRANTLPDVHFESFEADLLRDHAEYGCISLWCTTSERAHPFVFVPRIVKGVIPCAQLVYCQDIEDFVRFVQPLGWFLALRGRPLILVDSTGPIRGVVGKYFEGVAPKYFKGSHRPRLGDLAYTEAAMFGL